MEQFYYESRKQELKTRPTYECRSDERLKIKSEKSTRLGWTGNFCLLLIDKTRAGLLGSWLPRLFIINREARGIVKTYE